jgi:hypothetical protein
MLGIANNTKAFKSKSRLVPDNIYRLAGYYSDIPKFIEIDFLTNSLIVVSESFDYKLFGNSRIPQVGIFRNYN